MASLDEISVDSFTRAITERNVYKSSVHWLKVSV